MRCVMCCRGAWERETRLGHDEHPPPHPPHVPLQACGLPPPPPACAGPPPPEAHNGAPTHNNQTNDSTGIGGIEPHEPPSTLQQSPNQPPHTSARLRAASASAARLRCASSCDAQRPTHPSMQKHSQGLRVKTSVQQTHANTSDRVRYSRKRTTGAVRAGVHKAHVRTRLRKKKRSERDASAERELGGEEQCRKEGEASGQSGASV